MEQFPTNKIDGFRERIGKLFPTMIETAALEGVRGGFFSRIERGTWMGHVIEHIAFRNSNFSRNGNWFRKNRETKTPGIY